ncbi:MAG: hypothetical protein LBJ97_04665 [Mycoplasmataceae bacterium]|jgi:hypothetical protein|nr:hypothetical protein [Mycoplasmataceae bacterium]
MTIPITIYISANTLADKIATIKQICLKNNGKEISDVLSNTIIFHFYNNNAWTKAKEEIQRSVDRVNFKLSTKRVIIMEEMKDTIVEPPQPPAWFLEFQKWIVNKFEQIDARFDKQDERLKNMDTHQPAWFGDWVKSDFNPLKEKVDKIGNRLDNVIRLNHLIE